MQMLSLADLLENTLSIMLKWTLKKLASEPILKMSTILT